MQKRARLWRRARRFNGKGGGNHLPYSWKPGGCSSASPVSLALTHALIPANIAGGDAA